MPIKQDWKYFLVKDRDYFLEFLEILDLLWDSKEGKTKVEKIPHDDANSLFVILKTLSILFITVDFRKWWKMISWYKYEFKLTVNFVEFENRNLNYIP